MEWQRQTRKCFEVTEFALPAQQPFSDHFSRSIILSRLGVDQSYTRNLPTSDLGGRRKTRRRGEQKKAKILSLSDKSQHNPCLIIIYLSFCNCSELQKSNIFMVRWCVIMLEITKKKLCLFSKNFASVVPELLDMEIVVILIS